MTKIIMQMASAKTWKQTVQQRAKHHRSSPVREAAKHWLACNGLDPRILSLLGKDSLISNIYPDCSVVPPGRGRGTKCDAFAIAKNNKTSLVCIEAAKGNYFKETIKEWRASAKTQSQYDNREFRLSTMCKMLGLEQSYSPPELLKYKFFYKTYAAVKLSENVGADESILIVQSFSKPSPEFSDFLDFCKQFGIVPVIGKLSKPAWCGETKLRLGWVECH